MDLMFDRKFDAKIRSRYVVHDKDSYLSNMVLAGGKPAQILAIFCLECAQKQIGTQRCWGLILAVLISSLFLSGCSKPTTFEKIQKIQTLHVITRNAPSIYYEGREGPVGFEFELAKLFAQELGLELDLKVASNRSQILNALENEYTHIAAAGMVSTEYRSNRFKFSKPYMEATPLVVYRYGSTRPKQVQDVIGKKIGVVSDSHLVEQLDELKLNHADLEWQTLDIETIDLMKLVQNKELDYAVITSTELDIHQAYYPRVKKGFQIGDTQSIAWYFPKQTDSTLIDKVDKFLAKIEEDGTLLQLKERYYGHLAQLNYVGARTFIKHINSRLPKYDDAFKNEAEKHNVDWRLLAAMGYQESHWRPNATSPTGVRGLMMLTRVTAKEMGIKNRLDPFASIKGGAKYFAKIKGRISDDIPEPDRTWFALASYNVGYGHLEDARILTEKDGKDPTKWINVKEYLPLLQKKKYYKQTRYGYARGNEPVIYVQNIRRYYDVLTWMTQPDGEDQAIALSQPLELPLTTQ